MTDPGPPSSGGFLRPFLVISSFLPLQFGVGSILGQTSGMLPQLMEQSSPIKIDREEATWIASIATIGTLLSSCVSGLLSDMFGRIHVSQASYFFIAAGYAIMVAANSFMLLVVGRFLAGIGIGCSFPASVYVSETAPPAYRGILLSLTPLATSTGILYMYVVGSYLPWNIAAGTTCLICIIGIVITHFCYDSPVWLIRKSKIKTALKSLQRIEGPTNADAKLKELIEIIDSQPETKFDISLFAKPTVWKPFLMLLVMSALQNTAGFYIVTSYTVDFMKEFHSKYDPLQITVVVGVVRLLGMSLTSYLLRRVGRKTIGAVPGFGSAVPLVLIYLYLKFKGVLSCLYPNSWIPVALFLLYIITMTLGMFPLPWTMATELFPIDVRGMMSGVSCCSMFFVMFFALKAYQTLLDFLRLEGMILMFAVSSVLFGVFSERVLVETHNKALEEIEEVFAGCKREKENSVTIVF